MALTIRLKPGETIAYGDDATITVLAKSRGNRVFLRIDAPRDLVVRRMTDPSETQDVDESC